MTKANKADKDGASTGVVLERIVMRICEDCGRKIGGGICKCKLCDEDRKVIGSVYMEVCFNSDCPNNDKSNSGCNIHSRHFVSKCGAYCPYFDDELPTIYAYRIYNPENDSIRYDVTTNKEYALSKDGFPIKMRAVRELSREA